MMEVMWKSFSHIHTHGRMNEANDIVMNVGILKGFLNIYLMNDGGVEMDTFPWVEVECLESISIFIRVFPMNEL